jgi:predicted DNA-binding transcriptional regulator AlpA
MTPELQAVLNVARNLKPDDLPLLLGELETVRAVAWSRLTAPAPAVVPAASDQKARDELLDVDQAAARLGMSAGYLYHNHKRFPFSRRVGRSLRFSAEGIDSYIRESGHRNALTPRRRTLTVAPVLETGGTNENQKRN